MIRRVSATTLLVFGVLAGLLAPPAIWARNLVLDTDSYTNAVAPFARDPGMQAAVVAAVDAQFTKYVDVRSLSEQALPERVQFLVGPIDHAVSAYVHDVTEQFVGSRTFLQLWDRMNHLAHSALVDVLTGGTGESPTAVTLRLLNGRLTLDLSPVVSAVRKRLVSAGLTVAASVPVTGVVIEIARLQGMEAAAGYVRLLDHIANWLPWVALLFLGSAVLLAQPKRRMLMVATVALALAMLALWIAVALGRAAAVSGLPDAVPDRATIGRLVDSVLRDLRLAILSTFFVALAMFVAVWLTGRSMMATRLRGLVRTAPTVEERAGEPIG